MFIHHLYVEELYTNTICPGRYFGSESFLKWFGPGPVLKKGRIRIHKKRVDPDQYLEKVGF